MVSKRDFPTSKEIELYALAVVNFVCCHSYAGSTTDDCEYVRTRSPTVPPKWMSESPHTENVTITNFAMSNGYRTSTTEGTCQPGIYGRQSRNPTRMLDTKGLPPRPVISYSPESDNTWNLGTWAPENMPYRDVQEPTISVASSSDSSIFGHPLYSLQACNNHDGE